MLHLGQNAIQNVLPPSTFGEVSSLQNLKSINLSNNGLQGWQSLVALNNYQVRDYLCICSLCNH